MADTELTDAQWALVDDRFDRLLARADRPVGSAASTAMRSKLHPRRRRGDTDRDRERHVRRLW